jgi:signal transduction histidine kinase
MRLGRFAPMETIRGTLIVLIGIVLAPLLSLSVYEVVGEYRDQRDAEVAASAELARAVASAFDAFVGHVLRTEHAIAVSVALRGRPIRELEESLDRVREEYPAIQDMSWADARGVVLASTAPQLVGKSLLGRDYFQDLLEGAAWKVSPLVRSLVDGQPVFVVARAFRSPSGDLQGVVTAAVDADGIGDLLGQRTGAGITSITDSAGVLVAIEPPRPLEWETRHRTMEHPWVQRALAGEEALGIYRSPLNGERRVGAIVPIRAMGWTAHASRPLEEAMALVQRGAAIHGVVLLAVALGALGAALMLARRIAVPLRALEHEAGRLASGGSVAVLVRGPAEVRRVAHALESMAASLAARRGELEAVNRRLEGATDAAERAAAAAAADGAELAAVIAALPVGLVIVDPDRNVLRMNDQARDVLVPDDRRGAVAEREWRLRATDPDGRALPVEAQPHSRALRGELVRGDLLRIERGGRARPMWLAVSAAPIRDPIGVIRGAVVTSVDITQLRELQEERETLMQMVSHDLRTPLHVIVGHAQLLRARGDDDARRRGEAILASAGRMTRLIGDLVDAARLEAGHLGLQLEPVELAPFLAGWKHRMAGALAVDRVRLTVPEAVPIVLADPARLDQILSNLVSNALKYSVAESEVRVELRATQEALRLSVSDRGSGITPDELPRLFERYYRATSAVRAEGLGLGLFITRKLVEAHGWRIDAESELGKGSVFTVVIPLSGSRAMRSSEAA